MHLPHCDPSNKMKHDKECCGKLQNLTDRSSNKLKQFPCDIGKLTDKQTFKSNHDNVIF